MFIFRTVFDFVKKITGKNGRQTMKLNPFQKQRTINNEAQLVKIWLLVTVV